MKKEAAPKVGEKASFIAEKEKIGVQKQAETKLPFVCRAFSYRRPPKTLL